MTKPKFPLSVAAKKKLHEEWSELATGDKNGLDFDPKSPVFSDGVDLSPITHAYGRQGYEIHIRSGIYYAAFSLMNKKDKVIEEKELPLFQARSKRLNFPYKFKIKGRNKIFTEAEFREIEAALHSNLREIYKK